MYDRGSTQESLCKCGCPLRRWCEKNLKIVGQAHIKASNEYDTLMGASNFWDTAAASIIIPDGEDEMTSVYAELVT